MDLSGRIAAVTGAAQGIGRAVAHHLAAENAAVALLDRDGERVKQAAGELKAASIAAGFK